MNLKEIKQVLKLMDMHGLTEFRLERDDEKLLLRRQGAEIIGVPQGAVVQATPQAVAVAPQVQTAAAEVQEAPKEESADDSLQAITSPMVGTFYTSSGPDSEAYISIGDTVSDDTVVCIVEAMKIMNEIKAEISGTIEQICVQNGQPVEFGQELFKVRV